MNCTVCGKPHTKEQPLTIAHNGEWLCPDCLDGLDNALPCSLYGKSPIDVATDSLYDNPEGALRNSIISGYSGKIKVGNLELPIERFEIS